MNDYNKESQPKTVEPDVPEKESKDSNVILPTSEMTLADSVYATFQSGLTAVSNLNLKSGIAALSQEDNESYIPEEDETNQLILESALTSSTRDPMQAHILDQEHQVHNDGVMPSDKLVGDDSFSTFFQGKNLSHWSISIRLYSLN